MRQLILASTSPRRKELMQRVYGKSVEFASPSYEEKNHIKKTPAELVKIHALAKAQSVAPHYPDALVIGSDTIVVLKGKVLGKPKNPDDAKAMLKKLSNNRHTVYTGVAVIDTKTKKKLVDYDKTDVFFKRLSQKEIDAYVATGEPLDKAGAYGIQEKGIVFIRKINGDFFTVMGLPVFRLNAMLSRMGVPVF